MHTVGIRELKTHASEIVRRVREEREVVAVSYHGTVVAHLVPVTQIDDHASEAFWDELEQLAAAISEKWPKGVSSEEAVREQRRTV